LANRRGDIILHINPRLSDHQLVLNAAPSGNWGGEDRKPVALTRGQPFSIIIMVTEQCFKVKILHKKINKICFFLFVKIAVNNQHTADFYHRMPFNAADLVTVKGEVSLTQVQVYPGMSGQHGQPWRFAMVRFTLH
jgi:hypothetical protein